MSFAAPLGLLGLLALPGIWWLHRRSRAPRAVTVASLLFFTDLPSGSATRRARRFDPVLALLLLGAAAAAFAAAGPQVGRGASRRMARVVVESGWLRGARGYEAAVESALAGIRAELPGDVELDVVTVTPTASSPAYLETLARLGAAWQRYVIARVLPAAPRPGVRWWPLDLEATWDLPPGPANVGIVAVGVVPTDTGGLRVQTTLEASREGRGAADVTVVVTGPGSDGERLVAGTTTLQPGGAAGLALELTAEQRTAVDAHAPGRGLLRVALGREDVLPADDTVDLEAGAETAALLLDPGLESEVASALRAAAEAGGRMRLGDAARGPWIHVIRLGETPPEAAGVQALVVPAPSGHRGVAVPARAAPVRSSSPLVRDLAAEAGSVRLSPAALDAARGGTMLLGWRDGDQTWPLLVELPGGVLLTASLLDGRPPLRTTPFLPLLLDNLVDDVVGPDIGAGWRAHRLRPPSLTRLVRTGGGPRGVATAEAAPASLPAHRLRQPLLGLAALALLGAWLVPVAGALTGRARGLAAARR
ncbi:MAG: BatA domain-containing protein [Planctomycetota bacterium]